MAVHLNLCKGGEVGGKFGGSLVRLFCGGGGGSLVRLFWQNFDANPETLSLHALPAGPSSTSP